MGVNLSSRFTLKGFESLIEQVQKAFGKKPIRVMTQIGLFSGFDELSIIFENGDCFQCLVSDGEQVSDWKLFVRKEASR